MFSASAINGTAQTAHKAMIADTKGNMRLSPIEMLPKKKAWVKMKINLATTEQIASDTRGR